MIKKTTKSSTGTSFYGDTIRTSLDILTKMLGEPNNIQDSKTAFEWVLEIDRDVFTIYDYKEEIFFDKDFIDWHIGAFSQEISKKAKEEIEFILK